MKRFSDALARVVNERDSWDVADDHPTKLQHHLALHRLAEGARIVAAGVWRRATRARAGAEAAESLVRLDRIARADIVICSMAERRGMRRILAWLPVFEQLAQRYRIAFVVQDHSALLLLKCHTALPVFLGTGNGGTEHITKTLSPFAVLYLEQAKHNLRETAYHRMLHVYLGSTEETNWINNRLRGFDVILAHGERQIRAITARVHDFPPTSRIINLEPAASRGLIPAMETIERSIDPGGP